MFFTNSFTSERSVILEHAKKMIKKHAKVSYKRGYKSYFGTFWSDMQPMQVNGVSPKTCEKKGAKKN